MAVHTEDTLRCPRIPQIFNLPLTIAALKTSGTKGLVSGQYRKVFDLVTAIAAAVGAVVADQ